MKKVHPTSKLYRLSTMWSAFKTLYGLTPEQVDSFLKSYEIYDCEWKEGQAVNQTQTVPYEQVKQGLLDWYGVLNHLSALGEVEKMYIPPALDLSKGVIQNQLLFEKQFAKELGIKGGDKVLDLGCGKGRVAAHIASSTGAEVTGINIDQGQLDNAIVYAKQHELPCNFKRVDFNDLPLPFADNAFDALYEIQAFSLAKDLEKLFKELFRLLKPGGKISLLDWVRLPKYDPQNPRHAELMKRIKPFIGAIGTPSPAELENLFQKTGFNVLLSCEPSINGHQEVLIDKAGNYELFSKIIKGLVKIKVFPQHFDLLLERFTNDCEALIEAEQQELVTTSYHIIAEKRSNITV